MRTVNHAAGWTVRPGRSACNPHPARGGRRRERERGRRISRHCVYPQTKKTRQQFLFHLPPHVAIMHKSDHRNNKCTWSISCMQVDQPAEGVQRLHRNNSATAGTAPASGSASRLACLPVGLVWFGLRAARLSHTSAKRVRAWSVCVLLYGPLQHVSWEDYAPPLLCGPTAVNAMACGHFRLSPCVLRT